MLLRGPKTYRYIITYIKTYISHTFLYDFIITFPRLFYL